MKTIALANQKGGVGKTTTAASLGIGLSRQGKKVLLIDADAQGNLTQMLGWPQPDELSPTLSTLMEKIIAEQPIAPGEGILHHTSGVHLVPADIELSALEVTLVNTMSRETVLRQYLSTVADRYDYALIDCMPSLGIALSIYASGKGWRANFEYFMNREYAYNRDKGKCKCCGRYFSELIPKHCHHVNPRLPIERINKVPNLAWLCIPCHRMVHNSPIPPELDAKAVRKIKKYREKLKK